MSISARQLQQIFEQSRFYTGGQPSTAIVQDTPATLGSQKPNSSILSKPTALDLHVTKQQRKRTLILAPFQPEDRALASKYARYTLEACQDSYDRRHEAPVAYSSFSQVADVATMIGRDGGFQCVLNWIAGAEVIAVYEDYGITPAMQLCLDAAKLAQARIEHRSIGKLV